VSGLWKRRNISIFGDRDFFGPNGFSGGKGAAANQSDFFVRIIPVKEDDRAVNAAQSKNLDLSIIVPIKNERDNIEPLIKGISAALEPLGKGYEILYVDDGSTDGSFDVLQQLRTAYPALRVIKFDRNYGQTAATDAGCRHAVGDVIVTMDGDLQNDPADIPLLLDELQEAELVCGYRRKRRDTFFRLLQSRIANAVRNWVTRDDTIDTGCSLKAFRRQCFERIKLYEGMHRFLPTLFKMEGYRVRQVPVRHHARARGITKYSMWNRLFKALKDLFAVRWMQSRRLRYKIEKTL
jgi:dolichol-phosphate mannosyltransferase